MSRLNPGWKNLSTVIGHVRPLTSSKESVYVTVETELFDIDSYSHTGMTVWITFIRVNGDKMKKDDCNYSIETAREWHEITVARIKLFIKEQQYNGVQSKGDFRYDELSAITGCIDQTPMFIL